MTDPTRFRDDLERVPESLFALATAADAEAPLWPVREVPRRLLLVGMGSSHFAADVCGRRLRVAGIDAAAQLASVAATWPATPDLTVIAISAGGSSAGTLHPVEPHVGTSRVIALTNRVDSELAALVLGARWASVEAKRRQRARQVEVSSLAAIRNPHDQ